MNIKWYGHSCFLITDSEGTSVLTDPCPPEVGYDLHGIVCDAVTVSHKHFDHCYLDCVDGSPIVIDTVSPRMVKGIRITGYPVFHDRCSGAERGGNIMYLYEIDGMRVLHAGDVGHLLSVAQAEEIGKVDVLLVPIGGKYTLDYLAARQFANQLRPSVVIPMHYRTPLCRLGELDDVNNFIDTVQDCRIHMLNDYEASLMPANLGEDRVLVLDPYVEAEDDYAAEDEEA